MATWKIKSNKLVYYVKLRRCRMNRFYLMKYISYQLHTIVKYYGKTGTMTDIFCGRPDFDDSPLSEAALTYCRGLYGDSSLLPIIFEVDSKLCYGWVPDCCGSFMIGPVRFPDPVLLNYRFQTDYRNQNWILDIPLCSFQDLINSVLLLYNLYHEEELEQNRLLMHCCIPKDADAAPLKFYSELVFQNQEYGRKHNPYSQEIREQYSIEQGDPALLQRSIEEDYIGELGTLSKDFLRNWKYLAVVVITLACRSAIRGGLTPEIAFSLSDSYIQKVDESSTQPHVVHLLRTAEFQYARMVQEQKARQHKKSEKNPYIEQCKYFIFSHLHEKLEVTDIAHHLCLNANYLSELFHEYEGITLKAYIQQEKTELAKNLLTYSHYTYSEIAAYLGYSSQSHFGKNFKQSTGHTPGQYRREYGSEEFL